MIHHVHAVLLMIWIVELLSRFLQSIHVSYKIDCITIYLLVWQLTSIGCQFISQQLYSPVTIIEQGLFCIFAAIVSFAIYDVSGRYVPFQVNLLFFWLCSFIDILFCLHPNGWLRNFYLDIKTIELEEAKIQNNDKTDTMSYQTRLRYYLKKIFVQYWKNQFDGHCPPFIYYTHAVDNDERGSQIGAGDFLTYNTLLLLILSPFSSILIKFYITFGCIICIITGLILTNVLGKLVKQYVLPGIPLPVMIFSMYIIFLDIFITHPSDCVL